MWEAWDKPMPIKLSTYLYPGETTQTLAAVASAAGLPAGFDWTPYAIPALAVHVNAYGKAWSDFRYTNPAAVVYTIVNSAIGAYPQLNTILPQIAPGSAYWTSGEALRQSSAERSKASDQANTIRLLSVLLAPVAVAFLAPAAGAGAGIAEGGAASAGAAAGSGIATVEGAELALMVEAGTVGVEGAFLEAAALSGSSVTFSTSTGALMSAVTPAGETIVFDAAVDPFTQFGEVPIDTVKMPEESLQTPNQTPQTPSQQGNATPQGQSSDFSKPVTEYAKKLIAGEALKLLTGGKQSPGATATASKNAAQQGLAPEGETGDITPLVALAMIAGAFMLR
jgi:hypothetical protein